MSTSHSDMQVWGGIECTINRVGDTFHDQYTMAGHRTRVEANLELVAGLGISTLRTALHWEHFAQQKDWSFADRSLSTLNRLGIHPIAGLLHHGSGPPATSLVDPAFPEKLCAYALQVAQRYPWLLDYTVINEPQTTGRFACLYRHWYPHYGSMQHYLPALLNQIKGVALSMQAIRTVQPAARLIHTEDAGVTYATPELESYRIEREHRRWLGLDLLCGHVTQQHPLFRFLLDHGIPERDILWFAQHPCPPSIIGLNYYVTSDRFLDHRVHLYPAFMRGGDTGAEPLVDVEAVRIRTQGIAGIKQILTQAWDRYHLPLAVTEAHLGGEPQQQVRWLAEIWQQAGHARAAGVDVRAVTAWALFGLYNWSVLCTRDACLYEPGVFDISAGEPAPTQLTALVRQLASGHPPQHQALHTEGWWRRHSRLTMAEPSSEHLHMHQPPPASHDPTLQPYSP